MTRGWTLVLPVKDAGRAKSRLDLEDAVRARLALSFALDTTRAALRARRVEEVVVVTSGNQLEAFRSLGATAVLEPPAPGLLRAVRSGIDAIRRPARVGVMLADLPALRSHELDAALRLAAQHDRAMVPDAEGTGTVLVTARRGVAHRLKFGADSRRLHRAAGYREIAVAQTSGLRNDVDDREALMRSKRLGWGVSTLEAFGETVSGERL